MVPTSPRGWLCWSVSISNRYEFPHGAKWEYTGRADPRVDDRRESSISVKMLAERASHRVCGNGRGYELLMRFFVGEASWYTFSVPERRIIEKTVREFRRALIAAGFLPP